MGRLYPKFIILGLFSFAILTYGCSEEGLPTGTSTDDDPVVTMDSDGDNQVNSDSNSDSDDSSGDSSDPVVTEYALDDLSYDCGWDADFPNPYNNMSFDEAPRWSVCSPFSISGMTPPVINPMDSRYYRPDEPHTTVAHLDEPVDEVSLLSANHRAHRSTGEYYSSLIAYDENGAEIAIDENLAGYQNNNYKATELTVSANSGKRIHSIGVTSYQNATYFDNFAFTVNPEEEPDLTPPEIDFTVETESIWPPDHRMVLAVSGITATDDSEEPVVLDVNVESDEPVNGHGDGNTDTDWEIQENDDGTVDVYVRAERSGLGDGRVYTVSIRAEDAAGNVSEKSVEISVPHDQGNNGDNQGNGDGNDNDNGNGSGNGN